MGDIIKTIVGSRVVGDNDWGCGGDKVYNPGLKRALSEWSS